MSIRDVLEKRRRILIAVGVGAILVLFLGVQLSVTLHRPWLAFLGAIVFFAAAYLNAAWLRCPRCHRSIGFARERPRKLLPPFGPGEMCPYCAVSLEESWDRTA
jgi:purine-cytosine permease-like protein